MEFEILNHIGANEREFKERSKEGYHCFLHNSTLSINQGLDEIFPSFSSIESNYLTTKHEEHERLIYHLDIPLVQHVVFNESQAHQIDYIPPLNKWTNTSGQ